MKFNEYLKGLREKRGYSINRLASAAGVSDAYLSQIETGKRGTPSPHFLKKLAPVLEVNYEELMVAAGYLDPVVKIAASSNITMFGHEKLSREELKQVIREVLMEDWLSRKDK